MDKKNILIAGDVLNERIFMVSPIPNLYSILAVLPDVDFGCAFPGNTDSTDRFGCPPWPQLQSASIIANSWLSLFLTSGTLRTRQDFVCTRTCSASFDL